MIRLSEPGRSIQPYLTCFRKNRIGSADGYEIDPHYGTPAAELWGSTGLNVHLEDFTQAEGLKDSERFNLLICNPPYVRHHYIVNGEKQRLKVRTQEACGVEINGPGRAVLLLPRVEPCVDDERRLGGLVDPERVHGRELWRFGEGLSARQGDAAAHSSLRPE